MNSTSTSECASDDDGGGISVKTILGIVLGLLGSICINTGQRRARSSPLFLPADRLTSRDVSGVRTFLRSCVGNNIQSYGLHKLEAAELKKKLDAGEKTNAHEHPKVEPCQSKIWIMGTCIFVSGSLLNSRELRVCSAEPAREPRGDPGAPVFGVRGARLAADPSLPSPQFVSNTVFGKFVHKAVITTRMYLGTTLIVVGTLVVVCFSVDCEGARARARAYRGVHHVCGHNPAAVRAEDLRRRWVDRPVRELAVPRIPRRHGRRGRRPLLHAKAYEKARARAARRCRMAP